MKAADKTYFSNFFYFRMKYIKSTIIASIMMVNGALAFTSNTDSVTIFRGDTQNYETIHGEAGENSTLYFGDSLKHFITWDANKNMFVFSNNVDFGGNQIINARLENLTTAPTCDANASGRLYFNTTNQFSYVCNGTTWKQVDEEAQSPVPYVKSITPSTFAAGATTSITISGGNFTGAMRLEIPNFHGSITGTTIVSPTQITANITTAAGDSGSYNLVITDGKNSNTAWSGNGVGLIQVETVLVPNSTGNTLWTRGSGVTVGLGSIVPNVTTSSWNKGASFGTAPANTNFKLSFQPKYMTGYTTGGVAMIGLDATDPDLNYNSIDYSIYMNNGTLMVMENGSYRGSFGTYTNSDTLEIQRKGSTIEYYKNGTKFYTSSTASSGSMVFDSSLYQYLGATNIKLTY